MLAVAQHDVEDRFWCCHSALHRCLPRRLRGRWVREGARNVGRLYRASRLRLTLPRAGPFLTTPRSVDTVYKMFVLRTVERGKRAKTLAKAHLKLVTPATVNRTVTPKRLPNGKLQTPEHLHRGRPAHDGRQGKPLWPPGCHDGPCGLPARPAGVRTGGPSLWEQIEFRTATLHVRRVKKGTPSTHPILGDELRALRRLQREQEPKSPFVFTSERGSPFTTAGFARMVERAGTLAKLSFKAHPHMLRHACGYALANRGHDTRALQAYLGHRNIQHTVRCTELSPTRFKDFWRS